MNWITIITEVLRFWTGGAGYRSKWFILQMLLFVQLGNSSLVINSRPHEEHVCPSIDIRNHVDKFKQLENCTVIEGYLRIVLIDHGVWSEYESLAFPKLVEITDYLLIFRAYGLRSLSKLFPNLAVIRGQKVFVNYALVVFEVKDIEELGLPSLMSISRGAVRLEKNSNLCYIDTINWDIITNVKKEDNFIVENRKINECVNTCPRHGCPYQERHENSQMQQTIHKQPLCWDFYNCQKVCKTCKGQSGCYTDKTPQGTSEKCCHPNCLGGCYGPDATDCIACRNVSYHGRCQTSCPPGTYKYHDRRCISPEDCKKNWHEVDRIKWKLFDDGKALKCQAECPNDYMESKEDPHTCIKCHGPCPKVCGGLTIDSVAAAQKLRGCTVIHGILEIQIRGGSHVGSELEESLGMIQEVSQYVKIVRSYALLSLRFLKSLRIIHGDRLHTSRYALFVLDNHNLVDIWDFKTHPKLNITKGKVFFHFNRKLCLNKIDDLVESVGLKDEIDTMDVSRQTNGDQVACNITELTLEIVTVKPTFAIIRWNNFHTGDIRELLSWVVNYREAPQKNITVFDARDACGTDTWRTDDVRPDVDNSAAHVATIIHELKPYTQYAVYVNAYTISSATRGAMSAIKYFRTEPGQPSPARDIRVKESKSKELHITWKPPSEPNGNVTHYFVTWQPMKLAIDKFERRNYCEDRLTNYHKLNTTNKSTKTDEAKKKNETDESGCKCPKKEVVKPVDEAQRHFQIEFENALQNAIYRTNHQNDTPEDHLLAITSNSVTKGEDSTGSSMNDHMGGSSLYRKKRDSPPSDNYLPSTKSPQPHLNVPPALTTSDLSNYIGNSSSSLLNSSFGNGSGYGFEEEQEEDNLQYAAVYGKTELILPALHHFQEYSIEVIACHEYKDLLNEKYCSNRAIDSARTQPNPKADTIQHENITETYVAHSNGTLVRIRWPEPPDPNGLIVTYHLEMKRIGVDNLKPDEYCITHKQYKKDGGFTAQGLAPGNWTYRIRASSLAGFGPWTPYLFVFVEGNGANDNLPLGLIMGFISTAFILLIVMLFGLVCYIKKKRGLPDQSALYASVNPDYWGTSDVYLPDEWEVDRDKVELIKELGNGSFGMVYEGIAKSLNGIPKQNVAIKTVTENASIKDRIEFLNEASVMKAFLCHHVVQLIGVVSKGQPTLVIMELMSNGDLKTFLRMHRPDYEGSEKRKPPTLNRILQMAGEIADGMAYLSVKKFVHRDLAARNCMVADTLTVKIGDFGMTRDIYETDYYRKGGKGLLPVRWMAPESLRDGVFSSQSDVWSYGVVLWEMATLAAQPYQGLANEQVLKFVVDGKKMEMPENCPDKLYNLMMGCWKYQPSKRPTFNEIIAQLVPDLNENFRHVSFFFSDLNTQKDLEGIEATDDDDEEEEEDGGLEGVNTPLTGSPKHRVDLHHQEECISDYEHVNNDSNTSAILSGSLQNSGELDSSHSTLSYDSHLKHSPSSSPHNQNIYLANNIEKGDVQHFSPPLSKGDCVGEPCDPASNVLKNTPQYQPPPYMLRHQNELPSQQKWSPDTNSNPPSLPHSNEGSKGSSKSSRSSNGMNGISNGHIPRIIVPNPQC